MKKRNNWGGRRVGSGRKRRLIELRVGCSYNLEIRDDRGNKSLCLFLVLQDELGKIYFHCVSCQEA